MEKYLPKQMLSILEPPLHRQKELKTHNSNSKQKRATKIIDEEENIDEQNASTTPFASHILN